MVRFDVKHIESLLEKESQALLRVCTLGKFTIMLDGHDTTDSLKRDKAIQLLQFFLISRNRMSLHKEQIIDRLWEEEGTDQHFKVALHEIKKVLEPKGKMEGPQFVQRQGSTYRLDMEHIWLDNQALQEFIEIGNNLSDLQAELAIMAYQSAIKLYNGVFLPNRIYEDWTTTERDNIQMLAIGAHISLAELLLDDQAKESLRLTEDALKIDPTWEEAYRIQMLAHMEHGNRPQAIRTFLRCKAILNEEFGIEPLPDTVRLLQSIKTA